MSIRRLFSHHSHGGHHHSHAGHHHARHHNSNALEEVQRSYSSEHHEDHTDHAPENANDHHDTIQPVIVTITPAVEAERQQYRTGRRSSVQFLDRKFIQSLSNQTGSSVATDNDFKAVTSTTDDACEL
jgi:hypothetical protein